LPGNGKLGFAENQKTRKPENQNQNQKDQIRISQVNFEGSKLDVFRKFLQI
jgi:hypothetical protein